MGRCLELLSHLKILQATFSKRDVTSSLYQPDQTSVPVYVQPPQRSSFRAAACFTRALVQAPTNVDGQGREAALALANRWNHLEMDLILLKDIDVNVKCSLSVEAWGR